MEQTSYSNLPFQHISHAAKDAISYIDARKKHIITPLKTRWKKFNKVCGGGIEPNCVYTIGGRSGSGKSAFVNTLETDLILLNPKEDIVILSFSFEMLSSRQVGRKISKALNQTTSDLYSAEVDLSDEMFAKAEKVSTEISNYPIYYVDTMGSVKQIADTIRYFQSTIAKNKWLVVILDHNLLVKGTSDRSVIIDLQNMFIETKKIGKTSIIQISQMNREALSLERRNNPTGHYPIDSDLSGSDSIFQSSDVVAVLACPEKLGIVSYGPNRLPVEKRIYLHFLKQREGELGILVFENELKYNNLIEM